MTIKATVEFFKRMFTVFMQPEQCNISLGKQFPYCKLKKGRGSVVQPSDNVMVH